MNFSIKEGQQSRSVDLAALIPLLGTSALHELGIRSPVTAEFPVFCTALQSQFDISALRSLIIEPPISPNYVQCLSSVIGCLGVLETLQLTASLSDPHVADQFLQALVPLARRHLRSLSLAHCELSAPCLASLRKLCCGPGGLSVLVLRANRLECAGATLIAEVLQQKSCHLASLVLDDNDIGLHGQDALARAIARGRAPLYHFSCAGNTLMSDDGQLFPLMEALNMNTSIRSLSLDRCLTAPSGILLLCRFLATNTTTAILRCSFCPFPVPQFERFRQSILINPAVIHLELGNTDWFPAHAMRLKLLLDATLSRNAHNTMQRHADLFQLLWHSRLLHSTFLDS
jgi:hypothetical protein